MGKQGELTLSCAWVGVSKGGAGHVSESINIPVAYRDAIRYILCNLRKVVLLYMT
jgi:hypothetical protein